MNNSSETIRRPFVYTKKLQVVSAVVMMMVLALALGQTGVAQAATLTVDDDGVQCTGAGFTTIQAAVTAAAAGDTIVVCAGTYNENVTLNKNNLTLDGAGAGTDPSQHTIIEGLSPVNKGSNHGITVAANVTGITIKELRVQNFRSRSGIQAVRSNNDFHVEDVHVVANNTTSSNYGGIFMAGPVSDVFINNVEAHNNRTRGIVIWDGYKQNITITNNTVTGNNCCGIELQDGSASNVNISGNTVENNTDSGIAVIGLKAGAGPNIISNNIVRNNGRFGIEIKMPNGTGLPSGDGSIVVTGNTVEMTAAVVATELRDMAGIAVMRRAYTTGGGYVDIPTGVVVTGNTVTGYRQPSASDGFGIVVEGLNMTVSDNYTDNNDVGVQRQAGHTPYTPNGTVDGLQDNLADQYFGRGNSPVVCAMLDGNTYGLNTLDTRDVGSVSDPTVTNADTSLSFCSIQSAIDHPTTAAGHTLEVAAGTYVENIVVNKPLTINGSGEANTTLYPAISGALCAGTPSTCDGSSQVITIQAHDVTISNLTVDGDNPNLTSGVTMDGADVDARNGIITNHAAGTFNGMEVAHVTVKNIFWRAIYASSSGTYHIHDNTIENVQGDTAQSKAIMTWAGQGIVENNFISNVNDGISAQYSRGGQFLNNVITDASSGVHTDNAGNTGGVPDVLSGNVVSNCTDDGYGVWVFVPYMAPIVSDNTVTGCAVGLALFGEGHLAPVPATVFEGNIVDGVGEAASIGAAVSTSIGGYGTRNVAAIFADNHFVNNAQGLVVEEQAGFTASVTAVNNSFSGNAVAVQIDSENATPTSVNAINNWWGSDTGPTHASNPNGSGDPVGDNVDFDPWTMGTPVWQLIEEAEEGDVITLEPGATYVGGLVIDKPITLRGQAGTIMGPGSPAIIVASDDVTIEGIEFAGAGSLDPAILVQASDNLIVENNNIHGWATAIQVSEDVTSLKVVNNWIHDNAGNGLQIDSGVSVTENYSIAGNMFKNNGGNGVQNGGDTASLKAQYNSWGSVAGALAGDGAGGDVDVSHPTFAEIFVDVSPDTLATVRNVNTDQVFNVAVKVEAAGLYGLQYRLSYDATMLTLNTVAGGAFATGGCNTNTATVGVVDVFCARQNPAAEASGLLTISTLSFTANGSGLTGQGPWDTYFDLSTSADKLLAATRDGGKVYVNNGGFGAASVAARDITDSDDGQIHITGIANFTGLVDLQGRTNDSGADVFIYNQAVRSGATVLASATAQASGRFTTTFVGSNQLNTGTTYYVQIDRPLYLPATANTATSFMHSHVLDTRPLTTLDPIVLLGGDATNDNIINIADGGCVGGLYGQPPAACGAGGSADVNGDNAVNVFDLSILGGNYGLSASPWTP